MHDTAYITKKADSQSRWQHREIFLDGRGDESEYNQWHDCDGDLCMTRYEGDRVVDKKYFVSLFREKKRA